MLLKLFAFKERGFESVKHFIFFTWNLAGLRKLHSDQAKSDRLRIRDAEGDQDGAQGGLYGDFLPLLRRDEGYDNRGSRGCAEHLPD